MIKKRLLHYLPILIAIVLFLLCLLSLHIYESTRTPFIIVSYSAEVPTDSEDELLGQKTILALDLSVSKSGKIVDVDFPDERSYAFFESLFLRGKRLEEVFAIIAEEVPAIPNGAAFIGAFSDVDSECSPETLRAFLSEAESGFEKSCFYAYGTYTDEAQLRAQTQKVALGRMAYALYFAEESEKLSFYVDPYSILESDPYDIAHYIRCICADTSKELAPEDLCADISHVKEYDKYISIEEARNFAVANSELWYGYRVEDFSYSGIAYYLGMISYRFTPPEDEAPNVFYVGMENGEVLIGD